jgi:hypothetical protein
MLLAGVSAKVVSEMMGHSSVMVTLDTYSHVVQGLQEHAVSALDQYLVGVKREANFGTECPNLSSKLPLCSVRFALKKMEIKFII